MDKRLNIIKMTMYHKMNCSADSVQSLLKFLLPLFFRYGQADLKIHLARKIEYLKQS